MRAITDRPFAVNVIPRFGDAELIDAIAEARVAVATFFWDESPAAWVSRLVEVGTRVWCQVGSLEEARSAVAAGADALVVQGAEAGGHNRSTAATMTLVPAVADEVEVPGHRRRRNRGWTRARGGPRARSGRRDARDPLPDERGGRRPRRSPGADRRGGRYRYGAPQHLRRRLPDATVRGLRNAIVAEFEGRDRPAPYAALDPRSLPLVGTTSIYGEEIPLTRFNGLPPVRATTGDLDQMSLLAGETVGLIDGVRPAGGDRARDRERRRGAAGSAVPDRV
ncbi:MAG TPA: nitronate monooxygenase [Solirubrobacteraceae bacterium]|jgi:enoyl-[acyl-carrier protein] reductase II|nr:nitronate monooxygenase [Solirubrobacteraceae bacterium]